MQARVSRSAQAFAVDSPASLDCTSRNMKSSVLFALIALGVLPSAAFSDEKAKPKQPAKTPASDASVHQMINVQVEVFSVPRAVASALIFDAPQKAGNDAVIEKLHAMVKEGKAKLVASPAVTTLSGEKAVNESVQDFRYPSEFEPPKFPTTVLPEANPDAKKQPSPLYPVPTAFEGQKVGIMLECEAVADGRDVVQLNLNFESLEFIRMNKFEGDRTATEKTSVDQPLFYRKHIQTNVAAKSGLAVFLGSVEPDKELLKPSEDLVELVFVRSTIK